MFYGGTYAIRGEGGRNLERAMVVRKQGVGLYPYAEQSQQKVLWQRVSTWSEGSLVKFAVLRKQTVMSRHF